MPNATRIEGRSHSLCVSRARQAFACTVRTHTASSLGIQGHHKLGHSTHVKQGSHLAGCQLQLRDCAIKGKGSAFSALTLLVGQQEWHPVCKN